MTKTGQSKMTPHQYSYSLETNPEDYADAMSGPTDDAFMTDVRPTDPTARLELLEHQTTQLNGNIRWLMNRLEEAEGQVETLRAENLSLHAQTKKEPDINNPPMYEGDQKTLETWITACNLKFVGQPSRFPDERQKLVFATSYLKGPPLSWINPALNKYLVPGPLDEVPAELTSFKAFTETLKTLYGDPNLERNALTSLENLKQGTTVANYISRFAIHSQHANLNDVGLRQAFYRGLKSGIKDELATRDYTTLKELQTLATKLDARLRERALKLKTEAPGVRPSSSMALRAPIPGETIDCDPGHCPCRSVDQPTLADPNSPPSPCDRRHDPDGAG